MPDLTTKDALLERMVTATEDLAINVPAAIAKCSMEAGNNYIRFNNGIQVCWGNVTVSSGVGSVTFDVDFLGPWSYVAMLTARPAGAGTGAGRFTTISGDSKTKSGFSCTVLAQDGSLAGTAADYIAIGKWK